MSKVVFTLLFFCSSLQSFEQIITTVAGNYANSINYPNEGGAATDALLFTTGGVVVDNSNNIYVASAVTIHKIDAITNTVTTYAGTGAPGFSGDGGLAINAMIRPNAMTIDGNNNIYFTDISNRIRRIDAITKIITTVAGNGSTTLTADGTNAAVASLGRMRGIAIDASNNIYYCAPDHYLVRKINGTTNILTTAAGTGTNGYSGDNGLATNANIGNVVGVTIDALGNIFFYDYASYVIRKVNSTNQIITTIAGTGVYGFSGDDGPATSALLGNVNGYLSTDAAGNVYMVDEGNFRIRKITISNGKIETIAGNGIYGYAGDGGLANNAQIRVTRHLFVKGNGDIYLCDEKRVRKINQATNIISTVAGNGGFYGEGINATNAVINYALGPVIDPYGNIYIQDNANNRIRKVDQATNIITTIAGTGEIAFSGDGGPAVNAALRFGGSNRGSNIAMDGNANIYLNDYNSRIRKIDATTNIITTIAGTGISGYSGDGGLATDANIYPIGGFTVDISGNIYLADTTRIRKINATNNIITTIAGSDTKGYSGDNGLAILSKINPKVIYIDKKKNIYILDNNPDSPNVRKIDATNNIITTIAGKSSLTSGYSGDGGLATDAKINPWSIVVNDSGYIYLSDVTNANIRKIDPVTNIITTVAGYGSQGYLGDNDLATQAKIYPASITLDKSGNIYSAEGTYNVIRKISFSNNPIKNINNGNWNDPATWSTNIVPTENDHIILNYDIILNANATCKSLAVQGHSIQVQNNATLTITGNQN